MRPLYSDPRVDALAAHCLARGNRGMWYDKLFESWGHEGGGWQMPGGPAKARWIDKARREPCGEPDLLCETTARLKAFVLAWRGAIVEAETAERFVTGTGLPHPVENGFLWHHTLGVPYLPGSGVKGVVLAWDRDWANNGEEMLRRKLLGRGPDRRTADPGAAGEIMFLDALPPLPVRLDLDGVTPHDGEYYRGGGEVPPADWHSPTPIPFLAVAKGQLFHFPLVPRTAAAEAHLPAAIEWLKQALHNLGGGAKTAVDHGRFDIRAVCRAEPHPGSSRKRP